VSLSISEERVLKSPTILAWDSIFALSFSKVSFITIGALAFGAQRFGIETFSWWIFPWMNIKCPSSSYLITFELKSTLLDISILGWKLQLVSTSIFF